MSVAAQLGLHDDTSDLLVLAGQRWPGWVTEQPRLAEVGGLLGLRGWLRAAGPAEADEVLHSLATLAAIDGGDDLAATAALVWALLPGACVVAHRLRGLSPRIDEIVAAQLWVEARTFPWQRLVKVAANVLMNTRAGVLRECGASSQVERVDRTWRHTNPVDPFAMTLRTFNKVQESAAEELLDVLEWACEHNVITVEDRTLLMCLVAAADRVATVRVGRGAGGLMANDVSGAVAEQWGVSPVTVRRRARRSLRALTTACTGMGGRISA